MHNYKNCLDKKNIIKESSDSESKLIFYKIKIIQKNIQDARCGIFNSPNIAGDIMSAIYEDDEIAIDICYYWNYFEVFGLSDDEFKSLEAYYESLLKGGAK
jgi:hypothetical protein